MKSRRRRKQLPLPLLLTNLTLASWETIARRSLLIARNRCSAAEYTRMITEKAAAAAASGTILATSGCRASAEALIAPWYDRATSNAKRLRRK